MPDWQSEIRKRFPLRRTASEREIEIVAELAQHLEEFYQEAIGEGSSPEQAFAATLIELGEAAPADLQRQHLIDPTPPSSQPGTLARVRNLLSDFAQDVRFTVRSLNKQRGFALLAILALSLGIGSATVGYGIVENLLYDPYPYKDAGRLVTMTIQNAKVKQQQRQGLALHEFLDYRQNNHVFSDMVGSYNTQLVYAGSGGAETFLAANVTPNAFDFFGVKPLLGRGITEDDGKPGAPPVFVMNYRLWQKRFAGDRSILGQTFILNDQPRTLVGIMPPRFQAFGTRLWLPITMQPDQAAPGDGIDPHPLWTISRLRPGVTLRAASADLTVLAKQLSRVYPRSYFPVSVVRVTSVNDFVMGDFKRMLITLMAAVILLLLIACSNVANLLLARASARDREIAIRASIGASRGRLVRQLLAESFTLSLAGFLGGCLLAWWLLKIVVATIPQGPLPDEAVIGINPVVLLPALVTTLLTTCICGAAPALQSVRGDLPKRLATSGGSRAETPRHGGFRAALVVAEVALSLVLVAGAGLMARTFLKLLQVNPGFNPTRVVFAEVRFGNAGYDKPEQQKAFFEQVLERVQNLPGVNAAAGASSIPALSAGLRTDVDVPGTTHPEILGSRMEFCSQDFFRTLGLQLTRGRIFSRDDIQTKRHVIVVNQALAKNFFGKADPIGRIIKFKVFDRLPDTPRNAYFEIIGVISDYKNQGVRQSAGPESFLPYTITGLGNRVILVNTSLSPAAVTHEVNRAIWAVDRHVAMGASGSIEYWLDQTALSVPHFGMIFLGTFAVIGLGLAATGVFSVMLYTVSLQFHELGIRMALGAQSQHILAWCLARDCDPSLSGQELDCWSAR